jgi:DNA invertase Pin-like site-specific DNA recombinase
MNLTGTPLSENGRISTTDQNLDRQLSSTSDYAQNELGADLANIKTYRDKSTGTDTDRSGYRELMNDVEAGAVDAVVVHDTTRLSRSLQDLDRTVERVTETGTGLHFVRDNLPPFTGEDDPMARLMLQMLGAFAEWEARVKQMNTREGIAAPGERRVPPRTGAARILEGRRPARRGRDVSRRCRRARNGAERRPLEAEGGRTPRLCTLDDWPDARSE